MTLDITYKEPENKPISAIKIHQERLVSLYVYKNHNHYQVTTGCVGGVCVEHDKINDLIRALELIRDKGVE